MPVLLIAGTACCQTDPFLPHPTVPAWGGIPVHSPVTRMPSVTDPLEGMQPVTGNPRLASVSVPQYLSEPLVDDEKTGRDLTANPPKGRDGIFQNATFLGTWIPQAGDGDLGFTDLDLSIVFGFPFPAKEAPLVITPRFGFHLLDGPNTPDLPSRLYDAAIEWRHMRELSDRWSMDVSVTTGYYSDFEQDNEDAFRITGRGLAVWDWSETTQVIMGVIYLDRGSISVLPVGGLLIQPNDSVRLELVLPRPRIAWRLDSVSQSSVDERWIYLAGEYGGGEWAIERANGAQDVVESSDYRALLGIERKRPGWISDRFEIGYIFGREIEFDGPTPDYEPDDTLLLRYVLTY